MKKTLYAAALALLACLPTSAAAAPSPSPSLDSTLIAPPSAYSNPITSHVSGNFTALDFAATWGQDSARGQSELDRDGFVAGYGLARSDRASGRIMSEFVMAFTGQSGALRFLAADKAETVADPRFVHADTSTQVGSYYYGIHAAQASPPAVIDAFEFVKGNDMFGVAFYSTKDDVLALAAAQAGKLYAAAPPQTISANDWPENQAPPAGNAGLLGGIDQTVLVALGVIGLLLAGGVFVWMRRSETPRPAQPQYELSPDGNFWRSGGAWVAASEVAPPWAPRSPDGAAWWDGRTWRGVPGAAQLTPR